MLHYSLSWERFFLVSQVISWFGLLAHSSSLRLPSGLVLTLRTNTAARTSLPSPHLLLTDTSVWATPLLAVAVGAYSVGGSRPPLPPAPLCCPLRFRNSPKDPPVRGFPTMWKLLLLHDSLPRSPPLNLLSLFLPFIFCPPSFWRE